MSRFIKQTRDLIKMSKAWNFIKSGPIGIVTFIPIMVSIALLFTWGFIKDQYFPTTPQIYTYFCLATSAIIMGFVGVIYVFRKEMPGPISSVTVRGGCAVTTGLVLTLFSWLIGIAVIVFAFSE